MFRHLVILSLVSVLPSFTMGQQPKKTTQPWTADRDMNLLQGQWKVAREAGGWLPKHAEEDVNKALVDALIAKDAVLTFNKQQLDFTTAKLTTTTSNAKNKPEEVFKHGFTNDSEPYLVITPKDGKPITISYIVTDKALQIRYPARSCSRSGMILSFTRVEADKSK